MATCAQGPYENAASKLPAEDARTLYPVIFEDRWFVAAAKPAAVLSHPNHAGAEKRGAAAFEGPYSFQERCFATPAGPLWLIHRLDQDASGILLAAKDAGTAAKMRQLFEKQEVTKAYVALLAGRLQPARGTWKDCMDEKKTGASVRAFVRSAGPANALLKYQVKGFFQRPGLTLVEIELVTGRTHQIRVQAAYRRHPVAGDGVYGHFAMNKRWRAELGLKRLFLHSYRLAFRHPHTGKAVDIVEPLPEDLEKVLAKAGPGR